MTQNAEAIVVGSNSVNTLGQIRALGEGGISPILILLCPNGIIDIYVDKSKYLKRVHCVRDMDEALSVLLEKYRNGKRHALFAEHDTIMDYLDAHYDILSKSFHTFNCRGTGGELRKYLQKTATFPAAAKAGLKTIKTWEVEKTEGSGQNIPEDIPFPCFAKGSDSLSFGKADISVCANREELCAKLEVGKKYLVQEFIRSDYEILISGVSCNGGEDVYMPAVTRKLRQTYQMQGQYMRLEPIANYANLDVSGIKHFIREIGYEGLFSVEFLHNKGQYYFLEINLRNDGTSYLNAAAGFNLQILWYKYATGQSIQEEFAKQSIFKPLYLMQFSDLYSLKNGTVSLIRWIGQCLTARVHFVLNMKDMAPFLWAMFYMLRRKALRAIRRLRQ